MSLKSWWRNKFGVDVPTITNNDIVNAYVTAGAMMGDAVGMIFMGECIGFGDMLDRWEETEKAYAELGFRTLSIDEFVEFGYKGHDIEHLFRVPRKVGEQSALHAAYYRENFFKKMNMHEAVKEAFGGVVGCGMFEVPSTQHLKDC